MKLLLVLGISVVCTLVLAEEASSLKDEETSVATLEQQDKLSHILNVDKKKELDAFEAVESADGEIQSQTRIKRSPASKRRQLKIKLRNQRQALKNLQKRQRRARNQRIQQRRKRLQRKRQQRAKYNAWKNRRNSWVQKVKIRNEVARQLRAARGRNKKH